MIRQLATHSPVPSCARSLYRSVVHPLGHALPVLQRPLAFGCPLTSRAMTIGPRGKVSPLQHLRDAVQQESRQYVARGSGPGGQSVNKTMNAVTLIHDPTGLIVRCQDTRSIAQNKKLALQRLTAKVRHGHCHAAVCDMFNTLVPPNTRAGSGVGVPCCCWVISAKASQRRGASPCCLMQVDLQLHGAQGITGKKKEKRRKAQQKSYARSRKKHAAASETQECGRPAEADDSLSDGLSVSAAPAATTA